ncbi:MAG: helix-turn-helix domain-containing protein [Bdellovibrionales bacterium]|nr:helix-turn-helix domain-containing protein [Bdellovibrionales bacterium]NQZ19149.1 helix-turn-helix domain-containing protein [Bdellovibrionales bacterium]
MSETNDKSSQQTKLVDAIELGEILLVSPWTIRKWRAEERIPYVKIGRLVRYELRAVIASFSKGGIDGS